MKVVCVIGAETGVGGSGKRGESESVPLHSVRPGTSFGLTTEDLRLRSPRQRAL